MKFLDRSQWSTDSVNDVIQTFGCTAYSSSILRLKMDTRHIC